MVLFPTKPVPAILAMDRMRREQKGRPPRRRLRRPRRQLLPRNVEREYRTEILGVLARARELVNELLIPRLPEIERRARITLDRSDGGILAVHGKRPSESTRYYRVTDPLAGDRADVEGWAADLQRIISNIKDQFAPAERALEIDANVAVNKTSAFNRQQITRQIRGVLGVDVFLAEPELADELSAAVVENVSLIKSIPANYFDEIERIVLRGFRAGQRSEVLGDEIAERFQVTRRRGAFIARDQIESLNGNLTRNRQINLGIPGYIWRTSLDERVRGSEDGTVFGPKSGAHGHARLEGTKQSWDKAPLVDERTGRTAHPGQDFN